MGNQTKTNVAILTGGESAEHEISIASSKVVSRNLDRTKYNVRTVDISAIPWQVFENDRQVGVIDLNDFSYQVNDEKHSFDVVFVSIHGTPAEDGRIQGYFDILKIPYTCSSSLASAITFDKDICKKLLTDEEIKQAKSILVNHQNIEDFNFAQELEFPVFVKPNKNGSSYGTFKVYKIEELQETIRKAFQFDDEVLIEEFISGRELACGVFEKNGEVIALPLTEIIPENDFFDYEAKYEGKSQEITPADIPEKLKIVAQKKSVDFFKRLKLSGFARVDYFLKGEDLFILEINTIPGLSEESILPQEVVSSGMTLEEFFDVIIQGALK